MYKLGTEANIQVGTQVKMIVDPAIRDTHMKIHSAGHLIDLAVQRLSNIVSIQNISGLLGRGITLWRGPTWSTKVSLKTLKKL